MYVCLIIMLCDDQFVKILVQSPSLLEVDVQKVVCAVFECVFQNAPCFLLSVFTQKLLSDLFDFESVGDTSEQHDATQIVAEGGVDLPQSLAVQYRADFEVPVIEGNFIQYTFGVAVQFRPC